MLVNETSDFLLKINELLWDSDMLSFKCGYFDISKKDEGVNLNYENLNSHITELLQSAKEKEFKFLTAKIMAQEINIVNLCFRNNGLLIDTELTFNKLKPDNLKEINLPEGFSIQKHEIFWDDSLFELSNTLTYSRFFKDKNINFKSARKLWENSIYNNCHGRASYSIICFDKIKPIGLMNIFEKEDTSDIFLIALLPEFQNQGLGREMINYYENNLSYKIKKQIVETQLTNYQAQNFYTRMGYKTIKSKYIIHFWLLDFDCE